MVVLGRLIVPQDVHVLIPGIRECVTSHGKWEINIVADLIKIAIELTLRGGDYPGFLAQYNH